MCKDRLLRTGEYLLFPPRCCACGQMLCKDLLDSSVGAFCESCRRRWELSKLESCEACGMELSRCRCMPRILKKSGADAVLKLVPYDAKRDSVGKSGILYMKRKNGRRVFRFFAAELADLIRGYLGETSTLPHDVLLTYVPRSRKNYFHEGFDQSELMSRELGALLGCDTAVLLQRQRGRRAEQKGLDSGSRVANAERLFRLTGETLEELDRRYRVILVIDDVLTTGASLASAVGMLRQGFHGRIVCATLARTV